MKVSQEKRRCGWTIETASGAVAELVGNEGGVMSGVFNLELFGVEAPDWRPHHEKY